MYHKRKIISEGFIKGELLISKNNRCCICGNQKENFHPLCIGCSPYMYKKQSYPHQKLRRRKVWAEKRAQKLQEVGDKCEWCGREDQPFSIHHPHEINSRTYDRLWDQTVKDKINQFLGEKQERANYATLFLNREYRKDLKNSIRVYMQRVKEEAIGRCPKCSMARYTTRKTKTPKYRCNYCGSEFDKLKTSPRPGALKKIERLEEKLNSPSSNRKVNYNRRVANKLTAKLLPLLYDEIKEEYEKKVQALLQGYLDFEKTTVLCKKCHSAVRKGLVICEVCKNHFHSPRYERCYQCNQKQKGESKPKARLLRKYFDISLRDQAECLIIGLCLKCGYETFEQEQCYKVYLTEEDLKNEDFAGELCEHCYQEYQNLENKEYLVINID